MKVILIVVATLLLAGAGMWYRQNNPALLQTKPRTAPPQRADPSQSGDMPAQSIVAQGLDTPWAIAFLPEGGMLVTERRGTVRFIDTSGELSPTPIATLSQVKEIGEGGLLGLTLHPDFEQNKLIFFYYTYSSAGNNTRNRVVRMTYQNNTLQDEIIIVDAIPGASNHNGGRIKFGPDGFLYITTGDAQEPSQAQDKNSLAGKILRVTDEGKPAPGNPFGTHIYSYGHRNPQGLAWDEKGILWSTEHGPSGLQSGNDEVNKIVPGMNYGWPTIQGTQTRAGMVPPAATSGTRATWAPGGATVIGTSLFFTGLRGAALYEADVHTDSPSITAHLEGTYGRIRDVVTGPDGMLYIATSNRDGRGLPDSTDDRIIRLNPQTL